MIALLGLLALPGTTAFVLQTTIRARATRRHVGSDEVMQCLRREYVSFFDPLEPQYYVDDVTFEDPLSTLAGIGKYRNNVDMLAGRTALGKLLFRDASIALHDVRETGERRLRTRWTLRVTFEILPWKPVARFTGISDYELDPATNKVAKQIDYWDSIDLREGGLYERSSKLDGLRDFVDQVTKQSYAENELPYELLRRAKDYSIRRYPATADVAVDYNARPVAYDQLGAYAAGVNALRQKLQPFLPSVVTVPRDATSSSPKVMRWAVAIDEDASELPEPKDPAVRRAASEQTVVAVARFTSAATAQSVAYYAGLLEAQLKKDGLTPASGSDTVFTVAQYDAIYSVGDRRNEIWIPIDVPDYWQLP
mmetsp:Transcript_12454/g.37583  ORF Transcript_12454/g.37583 Transcript_12454/m.37583 type:complete len:366 (+) Transcript_12454:2-1099(+)